MWVQYQTNLPRLVVVGGGPGPQVFHLGARL